jgi:phospholipase D1/2
VKSYFGIQAGVMATHDEETRRFFKHSSVTCVLAPRYASSKLSFLKQQASLISLLSYKKHMQLGVLIVL